MPTCKQMAELATERAEGGLNVLDRLAFDRHLAGCDGCRAYLRQLEVARQVLSRLPPPELSPAASDALMAGFDAWAAARAAPAPGLPTPQPQAALPQPLAERGPAWRFSPWPALGTLATLALLVAFARHRSQAPEDWVIAVALAAAALALAAVAGRPAVGALVAAAATALAAALVGGLFLGTPGGLEARTGAECLAIELAAAALVGGAAWVGARRGPRAAMRRALAAGVVAGAVAADAALELACRAHGALPHLLVFHVGGVAIAAAVAAAILAARPPVERAPPHRGAAS
jgi:hypothetical protein